MRTITVLGACAVLGLGCSASSEGSTGFDRNDPATPSSPATGDAMLDTGTPTPAATATGDLGGGVFGDVSNVGGGAMDVDGDGVADCGQREFQVDRRPAEVLLVLDRSGSMQDPPEGTGITDSKWVVTLAALNQVIAATNVDVSWGLKVFPEGTGNLCQLTSVTAAIDVPLAENNATAVVNAINAQQPLGDGTPTGAAIFSAMGYLTGVPSDNPNKFILLATDGEPSCAQLPSGESQDTARPYAVQAVSAALTAGFPTFVVGVNTTKDTATMALNDMALAGGVARPDPNPLATKFYLGNTTDEIVLAFQEITGQIATCNFPLGETPPVPDNIGVRVNGRLLPSDPTQSEGWAYTNAEMTEVEVFGSFCQEIRSLPSNAVSVVFGCPGEILR